jgi:hypothetical protein
MLKKTEGDTGREERNLVREHKQGANIHTKRRSERQIEA